jgi:iron uptake system component EfeO
MRSSRHLALAVAGVLALAACGDRGSPPAAARSAGPVAVKATDTTCELATSTLPAGPHVFAVTNAGAKVTEFYVYGPGDRVLGEVENIAPGVSRELHVDLPAGAYQAACKPGMSGAGIRAALTVSGAASPAAADPQLAQAAANYSAYAGTQSAALVQRTTEFVAAVKARDAARAKQLYPVARAPYERIEPVAETFGDLDARIDGREDGATPQQPFAGFHKLEKDLWTGGDLAADAPVADRLLADVRGLDARVKGERFTALQLANGAKELLDEVANKKITGEEDRYSHTDLWDFAANVEGAQAAVAALRPALQQRDAALLRQVDAGFAAVGAELGRYRAGGGWKPHNELTRPQLKALSDAINALAEPVSRVAGAIAGR